MEKERKNDPAVQQIIDRVLGQHFSNNPERRKTIGEIQDEMMSMIQQRAKIVDFAKESANNQVFDLMIDYDRSLDEMVEAGRYDDVEKGITKSHFPIKGSGQHAVSAVPFHPNFGRKGEITLKGVTTEIRNRNYRPGRIEELLALGENHPDLQNRFPIVATGSIWRNRRDGVRRVPGLWNGHFSGAGRCLFLSTITRGWGEQYRFLAVCN